MIFRVNIKILIINLKNDGNYLSDVKFLKTNSSYLAGVGRSDRITDKLSLVHRLPYTISNLPKKAGRK